MQLLPQEGCMAVAPAAIIHQVTPAHRAKSCGFEAWPSHCWLVSVMQACRKESLAEPLSLQNGHCMALAAMLQLLCNLGTDSALHARLKANLPATVPLKPFQRQSLQRGLPPPAAVVAAPLTTEPALQCCSNSILLCGACLLTGS